MVPNPKLKLIDHVREVMRQKYSAMRTETCYFDWIHRISGSVLRVLRLLASLSLQPTGAY